MDETAPARIGLAALLVIATVMTAAATLLLVRVMVLLTPPCGGPWCLYALIYLPLSAIGALIVAVAIGRSARRGGDGYLLSLLGGTAGYAAVWWYIVRGGLLAP